MPRLYAIVCFVCVVASIWRTCSASVNSAFGTEFVFAPMNTAKDSTSDISLIFNNRDPSNYATIEGEGLGEDAFFFGGYPDHNVHVSTYNSVKIPYEISYSNFGTRVKTKYPVSLFVTVRDSDRQVGEGTLVFPVEALGTRYMINSVRLYSVFMVVVASSARSTDVSIKIPGRYFQQPYSSQYLQAFGFHGAGLNGTLIEASGPIAVFVGRNAIDKPAGSANYFWEQMVPVEKFGRKFVLVNPTAGQQHNPTITTILLLNGDDKDVLVDISGVTSKPISLVPGQTATVQTTNLTNKIHATGRIDVQITCGSQSMINNHAQWGLIPNNQFVDQAQFFVNKHATNLLSLVARTSDVTNSTSSLTFNGVPFNLTSFKASADPNYSYVITTPVVGSNFMEANFDLAGYLLSSNVNDASDGGAFGTIIGRDLSKNYHCHDPSNH